MLTWVLKLKNSKFILEKTIEILIVNFSLNVFGSVKRAEHFLHLL